MIIDMHRHLWTVFERYANIPEIAAGGAALGHSPHGGAVEQDVGVAADQIRAEMDGAGVDRSVLMLGDYGLRLGEPALSIEAENDLALDLANSEPDRFIAFFGIDPRRPRAAELFRKALDRGAKGLKLHPCAGFYPDDPVCRPLYELAGERGVPVAVHTGPLAGPLVSKTAHPIHLDEPAADFPQTTFIILHAGQRAWFPIALDLARWKRNIHLELAMWQIELVEDEARFIDRLDEMKKAVGLDRVLFGSDCPGLSKVMPLDRWVEAFKNLPETAARHDREITPEECELMLGGNAVKLLNVT